ncbi:polyamine ABC transporter substrate-binding protein [Advenella kashmirensis W13003]|uniref:Polyamine ABC transporter substrate-binding protein n=1 Tax=Advenella kashmirensis W13003 TaxID=1424334 RepID=V8QY32_9BURK|nr:ABC transporter permease [Advenella kashmirensis]ETF04522.1 polyamine ABC transporter substrate-binding protein [Advenella kashmirensis W13003]
MTDSRKALWLTVPLLLFLLLTFVAPIASFLGKSVANPEVVTTLPATVKQLQKWEAGSPVSEVMYRALADDLARAREEQAMGPLMQRLNFEEPGFRTLISKTARKLPFKIDPPSFQKAFDEIDPRWSDQKYWGILKNNARAQTPYYLLTALDLKQAPDGSIGAAPADQGIFKAIYLRTFWMAAIVTVVALLLAYPLAYLLARLPARISNLLMILVLLPFWTSLLVRTAAWIVLLQNGGLINRLLLDLGLIDAPVQLVFNRLGVYIAMVHIMLPFMILPLYSVMKGISPTYMRAAVSLGCHPLRSFWAVYFPQTLPGIGAGCLLVFITAIGYYITPALLGGPKDQMISYFIAFYTNGTINWGLAGALAAMLLLATLILYAVYSRLSGSTRLGVA